MVLFDSYTMLNYRIKYQYLLRIFNHKIVSFLHYSYKKYAFMNLVPILLYK